MDINKASTIIMTEAIPSKLEMASAKTNPEPEIPIKRVLIYYMLLGSNNAPGG